MPRSWQSTKYKLLPVEQRFEGKLMLDMALLKILNSVSLAKDPKVTGRLPVNALLSRSNLTSCAMESNDPGISSTSKFLLKDSRWSLVRLPIVENILPVKLLS